VLASIVCLLAVAAASVVADAGTSILIESGGDSTRYLEPTGFMSRSGDFAYVTLSASRPNAESKVPGQDKPAVAIDTATFFQLSFRFDLTGPHGIASQIDGAYQVINSFLDCVERGSIQSGTVRRLQDDATWVLELDTTGESRGCAWRASNPARPFRLSTTLRLEERPKDEFPYCGVLRVFPELARWKDDLSPLDPEDE
jgi:hypothetical protein